MYFTFDDAQKMHLEGKLEDAEVLYKTILGQNPHFWPAIFQLGNVYLQRNESALACQMYYRAASIAPTESPIWNNLGTALRRENHVDLAQKALEEAVKYSTDDPDPLINLGTLYINEGNPKKGEKYLRQAIQIKPDSNIAKWNLGLNLLEQGRWDQAWDYYAAGTLVDERMPRWPSCKRWNGEKDGTLLVYGEQGLGDEIMFASMYNEVNADTEDLFVECHPRLLGLFERSFPDIKLLPTRKDKILTIDMPDFDRVCAAGDLGKFYRRSAHKFPGTSYLVASAEKRARFFDRLRKLPYGLNVGIGWRGGYKRTRKDLRSLDLDQLRPLLEVDGVNWISLQYDPMADKEVADFEEKTGIKIHHWPEVVRADDYDETAALLSELDLSITVNTSAVHLAGALGLDHWTLTPAKPAWRYGLTSNGMIWYNSVRQFRQIGDDWTITLENVKEKLCDRRSRKAILR